MRPKQEKDTEDLYQTTRNLLENYAKLKSSQYLASDSTLKAQSALYSIVREGKELAGTEWSVGGWNGVGMCGIGMGLHAWSG